ncbi:hypothetical protein D3C80_1783970 [compost metagenome]
MLGHPGQGLLGLVPFGGIGPGLGGHQTGLRCLRGARVAALQIRQGQTHAVELPAFHGHGHGVRQGRRLGGLAGLPVLVAIPGSKAADHDKQGTRDRGTPFVPEMLELVELLLFFKV